MRRVAMCGLVLLLAVGCGGGDDDDPLDVNPNSDGSLTARVDGANFGANLVEAQYTNNVLGLAGTQISPTQTLGIGLVAAGPGTYAVGATQTVNGYYATGSGVGWSALGNIGSGSVTITTLTSTRAVGTFNFIMQPQQGGSGIKTVTQGAFDVRLNQ